MNTNGLRWSPTRTYHGVLALLPLLFAGWVWRGVLATDFKTDDFYHMYTIANYGFLRFVLTPHGGHVLVLRNAIFYLLYETAWLDPFPYFVSVLATHLVATRLLFLTISRLTENSLLACMGALLWGTAPINAGSLEWYSVYGHVLSTTIVLWILADLSRLAAAGQAPTRARVFAWYGAALAGATAFGTGLPVAMLLGPVAFLMLPPSAGRRSTTVILSTSLVTTPLLYVVMHHVYSALWKNQEGQAEKLFSLAWGYIRDWMEMLGLLLLWGANSVLFPGQQYGSGEFPAQATAIYALGIAMLVAFVLAPSTARKQLLAVTLLLAATYSTIAMGRAHVIEVLRGTLLWASSLPRYHYLGTALVAMLVCLGSHVFLESGKWTRAALGVAASAWFVWLVAMPVTPIQPMQYANARKELNLVMKTVKSAVAAAHPNENVFLENQRFNAISAAVGPPGSSGTGLFPGWAAVFILATTSNVVDGRQVFFRENDSQALVVLREDPNSRSASLFVGPSVPDKPASKAH